MKKKYITITRLIFEIMNLFFSVSLGSNSMYLHCTLQDRTLKILNKNVNVY